MGARGLTRRAALAGALAFVAAPGLAREAVETADMVLSAPDGRMVPVRVTWPAGGRRRLPLLILSHGANGTLDGLAPLQHGLTRGRIVAAPRHPDSEANPAFAKIDRAAVFGQRLTDMRLLLDSRSAIERVSGKRVDMRRIAAAGHSYGALVAQVLGGAEASLTPGSAPANMRDRRVKCVLALSPPGPFPGLVDAAGWAKMAVPHLVQTGTADVVPMIAPRWEAHMASFEAARLPGSALWVGREVDHYFGRNIQRLTRDAPDQSAQFRAALSIADRYLAAIAEDDRAARRWLATGGPLAEYRDETVRWEYRA